MTDSSFKKPIEKLYEDDCFVVFNKPAGLLVVPTPQNEKNTLTHIINFQYASDPETQKLYPCHRLDRETSGVILYAKGIVNQEKMMAAFKTHRVKKNYIAFVQGRLKRPDGELKSFIENSEERKYHRRVAQKFAVTRFRVLDIKKGFSVVEAQPITGRTNQIRIQFAEIGHPLVGDRKFSFARDYQLKFKRTALHAKSLEWIDSIKHKPVKVSVKLPIDMEVLLARHGN